jgi:hypothetical protein
MSRIARIVAVSLIMLFAAGIVFSDDQQAQNQSNEALIFGRFIGFGSGQFFLGHNGTGFLIGDSVGIVAMVAGVIIIPPGFPNGRYYIPTATTALAVFGAGALEYLISRIWEMNDLRKAIAGKVSFVAPEFQIGDTSLEMGISFRFYR